MGQDGRSAASVLGSLVAITACAPATESSASSGGSEGIDPTESVPSDASSSTFADDTSNGEESTGEPLCGGYECGLLQCIEERCRGCAGSEDCPADTICFGEQCVPPEDAPECLLVPLPVCGDGIIGALEECDSADACDDCEHGLEPEVWWAFDEPYLDRPVISADGASYLLEAGLTRIGPNGAVTWSVELDVDGRLTTDSSANVFVAGSGSYPTSGERYPYLATWDAQGALRWEAELPSGAFSSVAADETRVVAVGWTTQANTPQSRGLIAQYDAAGSLTFADKHIDLLDVSSVALADDETLVVASPVGAPFSPELVRLDDTGGVLWRLDIAAEEEARVSDLGGPAPDGAGGAWIWGEKDFGPWAARVDPGGDVIDRLECFPSPTGSLRYLAVGPDGRLAIGMIVSGGPVPSSEHIPWVARIDGKVVEQAWRLGSEDTTRRLFSLDWLPDGRIAAGLRELDPDGSRMLVLE